MRLTLGLEKRDAAPCSSKAVEQTSTSTAKRTLGYSQQHQQQKEHLATHSNTLNLSLTHCWMNPKHGNLNKKSIGQILHPSLLTIANAHTRTRARAHTHTHTHTHTHQATDYVHTHTHTSLLTMAMCTHTHIHVHTHPPAY